MQEVASNEGILVVCTMCHFVTAAIVLIVNCSYGEIQLYNGSVPYEGGVQICTAGNEWSAICHYSFECVDAAVACNQLGYTEAGVCTR